MTPVDETDAPSYIQENSPVGGCWKQQVLVNYELCSFLGSILEQGLSAGQVVVGGGGGAIMSPQGHLATSGDILL